MPDNNNNYDDNMWNTSSTNSAQSQPPQDKPSGDENQYGYNYNDQGNMPYGYNQPQGTNPYDSGNYGQAQSPYGNNTNPQGQPGYNSYANGPNGQGQQPGYNGYANGPGSNPNGYNDPYGGYYHPNNTGYNRTSTGAVSAVRDSGRSLPFLIGVIGYTIYGLFTLFMLFMPGNSYGMYTMSNSSLNIGLFIGLIPTTIIIIGMWLFYISCTKADIPSTTGITLSRGAIITNIVIISIASVVIIIGFMFLLSMDGLRGSSSYLGRSLYTVTMGLVMFIIIVLVVFLVLAIIYYVKLLKLTRIIRDTIITGKYCGRLPMYPLIINFILAAFNLFSLINVVNSVSIAYKIVSLLAALALIASFVSTTLSLFSLRTRLEGMR